MQFSISLACETVALCTFDVSMCQVMDDAAQQHITAIPFVIYRNHLSPHSPKQADIHTATTHQEGNLTLRMVFGLKVFGGSRPVPADASSDDVSAEYVPLGVIPEQLLDNHPELALKEYNLVQPGVCSNVVAAPHNACRLEMADMWSDILPSLQSQVIVTDQKLSDLRRWWSGFARFALTTSIVDDMIVNIAIGDIFEAFDKDATRLKEAVLKIADKNTVTLEFMLRLMNDAVEEFESMEKVVIAWERLSRTLCDIYKLVEETLDEINCWRRGEIVHHKDLERKVASVYTNKKRWGGDESKRGEMVIILTRWMGSEEMMRAWVKRNLGKKEVKCVDKWMSDYQSGRLLLLDSFSAA